jgi:hypothetical protein
MSFSAVHHLCPRPGLRWIFPSSAVMLCATVHLFHYSYSYATACLLFESERSRQLLRLQTEAHPSRRPRVRQSWYHIVRNASSVVDFRKRAPPQVEASLLLGITPSVGIGDARGSAATRNKGKERLGTVWCNVPTTQASAYSSSGCSISIVILLGLRRNGYFVCRYR